MIIDLLFILSVNILWLLGGQLHKTYRRVALPIVCAFKGHLEARKGHRRWYMPLMVSSLLFFILSMGYGESSKIRKWLGGVDWLTRLVISLMIVAAMSPLTLFDGLWLKFTITVVLNTAAWQVRAGSLAKIGKYDILLEDICRATALAVSLCLIK